MTRAWWFGPPDNRLRYDDNRLVKPGLALSAPDGELVICQHGMHASKLPLVALGFAPRDCVAWRVELQGEQLHDVDKICARTRLHLWAVEDTAAVLRHFARLCALDVVHLWNPPEIVLRYLKTGDESIPLVADAAWVPSDAASAALYARDAAWAAWAARAARDAAWAARAARAAARERQNARLHRMLMTVERRGG